MKKIVILIFVLGLFGVKASAQIKVLGYLTTNDGNSVYPTHMDHLGFGGYRVVADIAARNAITTQRRSLGMLVYVQSDNTMYVLRDVTLGNADWRDLGSMLTVSSLGLLSNLSVTGAIHTGTLSGLIITAAQPNITSLGQLNNLSVSGTIDGGIFNGTLSNATMNSITSLANVQNLTVTNHLAAGTIGGTISTAAQPNITSIGQLTSLSVSGVIQGGTLSGTLSNTAMNSITSLANVQHLTVTNNLSVATISGTLTTAAQPNITSVGQLGNLSVSGTVSTATLNSTSTNATRYSATMNTVSGSTASLTIDMSLGNIITIPIATNITTLTFSNPTIGPASYVIKIAYSVGTAYTISWPASVKWAGATPPILTCAAGKTDIISLIFDGTNYFGTYALNF